jgi:hypothetical protein
MRETLAVAAWLPNDLLNESALDELLDDPSWVMQEKHDARIEEHRQTVLPDSPEYSSGFWADEYARRAGKTRTEVFDDMKKETA